LTPIFFRVFFQVNRKKPNHPPVLQLFQNLIQRIRESSCRCCGNSQCPLCCCFWYLVGTSKSIFLFNLFLVVVRQKKLNQTDLFSFIHTFWKQPRMNAIQLFEQAMNDHCEHFHEHLTVINQLNVMINETNKNILLSQVSKLHV
jgi:hypothetical protein